MTGEVVLDKMTASVVYPRDGGGGPPRRADSAVGETAGGGAGARRAVGGGEQAAEGGESATQGAAGAQLEQFLQATVHGRPRHPAPAEEAHGPPSGGTAWTQEAGAKAVATRAGAELRRTRPQAV